MLVLLVDMIIQTPLLQITAAGIHILDYILVPDSTELIVVPVHCMNSTSQSHFQWKIHNLSPT